MGVESGVKSGCRPKKFPKKTQNPSGLAEEERKLSVFKINICPVVHILMLST